jgi:1,5-anhydro-D-fructose reductase (1,5-anhydro-D-mannitol-forming)
MIRFGIVGFGLHGVRRLMPGFALAKQCRVTALQRRSLQKARASAAEYGIPLAFDSVGELCASSEVDAVLVTSPDSLHLPDTLTAISHGKPVLCEKPMAMNARECRQMVEAALAAKVLLGVAHIFRFEESTRWFREQIAAGAIGRPVYARSEFCYSVQNHGRVWLTDPALAAGGPIADVGVHCMDTLRFVLQDDVMRVTAHAVSDERSGAVEAAGTMTLEFARGTIGTVMVSTRASYRTPFEVVGESGVLQADDAFTVEHPVELRLRQDGKTTTTKTVTNSEAYGLQVDGFAAAIRGEREFPAPGVEGWRNQEILDAAYSSVRSGRTENVEQIKG